MIADNSSRLVEECSGGESDRRSVFATAGELQAHRGSPVADHHLRQERVQLVHVARVSCRAGP